MLVLVVVVLVARVDGRELAEMVVSEHVAVECLALGALFTAAPDVTVTVTVEAVLVTVDIGYFEEQYDWTAVNVATSDARMLYFAVQVPEIKVGSKVMTLQSSKLNSEVIVSRPVTC